MMDCLPEDPRMGVIDEKKIVGLTLRRKIAAVGGWPNADG